MERKIETLLRLVSDMKRFENGAGANRAAGLEEDELSMEELELLAAAGRPDRAPFPWETE